MRRRNLLSLFIVAEMSASVWTEEEELLVSEDSRM